VRLGLTPPLGVNDVVVTGDGAYFTDSLKPFLYRVPIAPSGTPGMSSQAIPLVGDVIYEPGFNVNGIDATPNGKTLVIVQLTLESSSRSNPGAEFAYQIALDEGARVEQKQAVYGRKSAEGFAPPGSSRRAPPAKDPRLRPESARSAGNLAIVEIVNERLEPGPEGRLIRVVDFDVSKGVYYPPVDLDDAVAQRLLQLLTRGV
jgi:hypothetical protein